MARLVNVETGIVHELRAVQEVYANDDFSYKRYNCCTSDGVTVELATSSKGQWGLAHGSSNTPTRIRFSIFRVT